MVFKADETQLSFGEEVTFGTKPATTDDWLGLVNAVDNLPDDKIDGKRFYAVGVGRDPNNIVEGKHTLEGTIPIVLQNGQIIKFAFGSSTPAGADPYTHTIVGASVLPSFTLEAAFLQTTDFVRYFQGTKIDTLELSGEEEGELLATIGVKSMLTSSDTSPSSLTPPSTAPYMFYEAVLTLFGSVVAELKNFTFSLSNHLKPAWYFNSTAGKNLKYLTEGRREYELKMNLTPTDSTFWDYLAAQPGSATVTIVFTRGASDTFTLSCTDCLVVDVPHPIPEENEINCEMTVMPKAATVTVVDSIATY